MACGAWGEKRLCEKRCQTKGGQIAYWVSARPTPERPWASDAI